MSTSPNASAGPFDPVTKFWQDLWAQATSAMPSATPPPAPAPELLAQMRRAFFDAMARFCDDYMRSPQFLDMMKQTMDNALAFRKQLNEFLAGALHASQMPTQDDTGEVLETLHAIESRVLQRVEELSHRIAALERRKSPASNGAGRGRAARRTARTRRSVRAAAKSGRAR